MADQRTRLRPSELLGKNKERRRELDRWIAKSTAPISELEISAARNLIGHQHNYAIQGSAMVLSLVAVLLAFIAIAAAPSGAAFNLLMTIVVASTVGIEIGLVLLLWCIASSESKRLVRLEAAYLARGPLVRGEIKAASLPRCEDRPDLAAQLAVDARLSGMKLWWVPED